MFGKSRFLTIISKASIFRDRKNKKTSGDFCPGPVQKKNRTGPPKHDPNQTKTKGPEKKTKKFKKHKHLLIVSIPESRKCVILEIV